jgi:hypothetical protein
MSRIHRTIFRLPFFAMAIAWLVAPVLSVAHTSGFTYETTVGEYFVDIGASKLTLVPGELILFEYNLYPKADPNNLANFDSVYVTVGDMSTTLFSGFVHRPVGMLTTMSYMFPRAGRYEMSARFEREGGQMVEVTFPLEVTGGGLGDVDARLMAILIGVGLVTGAIGGVGWSSMRKRAQPPA